MRDDPQSIAAADFNGDGRLDLATANFDVMSVSTLQGNGDGTFATAAEATTGSFASALAAGDLNGDGSPDLVVANRAFKRETFEYGRDSVTVLLGDVRVISSSAVKPQPDRDLPRWHWRTSTAISMSTPPW